MRKISRKWCLALAKRQWNYASFVPRDSFHWEETEAGYVRAVPIERRPANVDGWVVPQGWDHEHCLICGTHIARLAGCQHSGFTDDGDWLCCRCLEYYVAPSNEL
jgi:hypothetical protein